MNEWNEMNGRLSTHNTQHKTKKNFKCWWQQNNNKIIFLLVRSVPFREMLEHCKKKRKKKRNYYYCTFPASCCFVIRDWRWLIVESDAWNAMLHPISYIAKVCARFFFFTNFVSHFVCLAFFLRLLFFIKCHFQ